MSDTPLRQSTLAQFVSENRAAVPTRESSVLLTELPLLGYVNLRVNPNDQRFLKAVEKTLGVNLPLKPNTGSVANTVSVLWLAPDEWLLITPSDQETQLVQTLGDSLGQIPTSVTDITGSQTLLKLSGQSALKLIAKGCSLDLHPRVFGSGQCAQTVLGKAPIVVWKPDETSSYNIIVRRTYADYLAHWLKDAGYEYGLALLPESSG